ncbi:hypothetical protein CRYUN_Cryun08bG0086200 [Craigia yunnanensis]
MEGNGLEGDGSNGEALGKCLSGFVDDGSTKSQGLSVTHKTDPSKRILVVFYGPGAVEVCGIRFIAGLITNKESLTGLIFILQNHITNQLWTFSHLKWRYSSKCGWECRLFLSPHLISNMFKPSCTPNISLFLSWSSDHRLVNITKHVLKPKHQELTEQERQRLLQKCSIEEKQLPRLLKKDAIARYYGFEKGQVIKVTYGGEITGSHVTYRCVW